MMSRNRRVTSCLAALFVTATSTSFAAEFAGSGASDDSGRPPQVQFSPTCKISRPGNQPQPGCTEEDLCAFSPVIYASVCKTVHARQAKLKSISDEERSIRSALRSSDELFSVEDNCSADAKAIGKGAVVASVVPFKVKTIETADPGVRGWNIVGMGAREIETTRCRFWFKKR